jgi:hypothetical protein
LAYRSGITKWRTGKLLWTPNQSPSSDCCRPNWLMPGLGLDLAGVRPDADVAAGHLHLLAGLERPHRPLAAVAVGQVDPVVQAERRRVHAELRVALGEPGVEHLVDLGPAVAVGVLQVEHVRGGGDDQAVPPRQHAGREVQVLGEQDRPVVLPVAVRVLQEPHRPAAFILPSAPYG